MRIADLATELKIKESVILDKLKNLKLRAKDGGELTAGVEMIVRDSLADEGIGTRVVEEEEPKKKKAKSKADKPVAKKKISSKSESDKSTEKKVKVEKATKDKKSTKVVKKLIPALFKEEGAPPAIKPKDITSPKVVEPVKQEAPVVQTSKVEVKPQTAPVVPMFGKVEDPKPTIAQTEKLKEISKPVIDVSKIEIPKDIQTIEPVKNKARFDTPFETVKPLLKKRKNRMDEGYGAHSRSEAKPSSTISNAVVAPTPQGPLQDLEVSLPITVNGFAVRINQKTNVVLKRLLDMGVFANINQNLPEEIVTKLASFFGFNLIKVKTQEEQLVEVHQQEKDDPGSLKPRSPVVTFMGHVDHGKTSLLDRIRSAQVAEGEHGGITQHIGSYSVEMPKGRITFLDTPGHEAFTAMRARGAHVTDIVVLVVAADEGIMPQTIEAIDHARAANVPIVVALNKIDKKNVDVDRVKKQLMEYDLTPEEWGGKTVIVGVSATTGEGIDNFLDLILLESELLELKANPNKSASGIVIEAHMSKGRGSVASLLVQSGTLKEGDMVVVGHHFGKVKALFDDHQRSIKEAGPSTPVELLGLSEVPMAGEVFYVVEDERKAREIAKVREE